VTPWVKRLITANVVVFFLQLNLQWLTPRFELIPAYIFVRPWTAVTYMFLHAGLGHILFNMLGLYFFGSRVEERLGSNRFFALYMISGISGALLSFFSYNAHIVGASGAVFGVMLAFARFWPREVIYIWGILPVEAGVLVVVMTIISLVSGYQGGGGIAHFTHLGGFAGAFLYLQWLDRTKGTRQFQRQATPKVADGTLANWRRVDPKAVHEVNRDEVNRILDKIGKTGIGSLTAQEKTFLSSFVPPDDRKPA
jgi:membrane associated rhomboid family serine protease